MITFVDTLFSANNPKQYLEQSSITAKQYLPSIFWSEVSICQSVFGCFLCQRIYFIRFFLLGFGLVRLCLFKILFTILWEMFGIKFAILFSPHPVLFLIFKTLLEISSVIFVWIVFGL